MGGADQDGAAAGEWCAGSHVGALLPTSSEPMARDQGPHRKSLSQKQGPRRSGDTTIFWTWAARWQQLSFTAVVQLGGSGVSQGRTPALIRSAAQPARWQVWMTASAVAARNTVRWAVRRVHPNMGLKRSRSFLSWSGRHVPHRNPL